MNVPPSIVILAVIALSLQVTTLAMLGWSAIAAIKYVASVRISGIGNGRRIAAYAIAWRAVALGFAVSGTAVGAALLLLSARELDLSADIWRAGSLVVVSVALLGMSIVDVYERVAFDRQRVLLSAPITEKR